MGTDWLYGEKNSSLYYTCQVSLQKIKDLTESKHILSYEIKKLY